MSREKTPGLHSLLQMSALRLPPTLAHYCWMPVVANASSVPARMANSRNCGKMSEYRHADYVVALSSWMVEKRAAHDSRLTR